MHSPQQFVLTIFILSFSYSWGEMEENACNFLNIGLLRGRI